MDFGSFLNSSLGDPRTRYWETLNSLGMLERGLSLISSTDYDVGHPTHLPRPRLPLRPSSFLYLSSPFRHLRCFSGTRKQNLNLFENKPNK